MLVEQGVRLTQLPAIWEEETAVQIVSKAAESACDRTRGRRYGAAAGMAQE